MLQPHTERFRDHYIGVINRNQRHLPFDQKLALLRKFLFVELLACEQPELQQTTEWRDEWFATEALPEGVDSRTADSVWQQVDEAVQPVFERKPASCEKS